jgi:hypothetical protein
MDIDKFEFARPVAAKTILSLLQFLGKQEHHAKFLIFKSLYSNSWNAEVEAGMVFPFMNTIEEVLLDYIIKKDLNLYKALPLSNTDLYLLIRRIELIDPR